MSDLPTRSAARLTTPEALGLPLVPPQIRARYAEAMAQIPLVHLRIRSARSPADLPATQTFG